MIPTDKLIKFYEEVTESINYYDDSAFKDPKGEEEDDEEGEESGRGGDGDGGGNNKGPVRVDVRNCSSLERLVGVRAAATEGRLSVDLRGCTSLPPSARPPVNQ